MGENPKEENKGFITEDTATLLQRKWHTYCTYCSWRRSIGISWWYYNWDYREPLPDKFDDGAWPHAEFPSNS